MKQSFWSKAVLFWQILNSKKTPVQLKLMFIAAVLYGISPMDLIPEAIPLFGLIDDLILIVTICRYIWLQTKTIRNHLNTPLR